MKRKILIMLIPIFAFALVGCGKTEVENLNGSENSNISENKKNCTDDMPWGSAECAEEFAMDSVLFDKDWSTGVLINGKRVKIGDKISDTPYIGYNMNREFDDMYDEIVTTSDVVVSYEEALSMNNGWAYYVNQYYNEQVEKGIITSDTPMESIRYELGNGFKFSVDFKKEYRDTIENALVTGYILMEDLFITNYTAFEPSGDGITTIGLNNTYSDMINVLGEGKLVAESTDTKQYEYIDSSNNRKMYITLHPLNRAKEDNSSEYIIYAFYFLT